MEGLLPGRYLKGLTPIYFKHDSGHKLTCMTTQRQ